MEEPEYAARWFRATDGLIAGVCKGIAEKLGVEVALVRIAWLCAVCFFGAGLLLYLLAALLLPVRGRWARVDRRWILGVCFNLAQRADLPVELVRLVTVFIAIGSLGSSGVIYLILAVVLPRRQRDSL